MIVKLDTEKREIILPINYTDKLNKIRANVERFNPNMTEEQKYSLSFIGYVDTIWKEAVANSDTKVRVAVSKPKERKKDKDKDENKE